MSRREKSQKTGLLRCSLRVAPFRWRDMADADINQESTFLNQTKSVRTAL
jgi:hypothetical protein